MKKSLIVTRERRRSPARIGILAALVSGVTTASVPPASPSANPPIPVFAPTAAGGIGTITIEAALAGEARTVTLDQALAAADAAPDVLVARAEERTAEAGIAVAKARPSPSFSIATHSITARESIAVSTPFRWMGQRRAAVDSARLDLETAVRSRAAVRAAARRSVREAWFRLAAVEQQAKIAAEQAERARHNSDAVSQLFESGRAARIDVVRAQAEAAVVLGESRAAEQALGATESDLGVLLGREPGHEMRISGDLPLPASEGPLEEWVKRASISSPDVLIHEERVRAAARRLQLARNLRWPGLGVGIGADFDDPTQPGTDKYAAMTLTLPLDGAPRTRLAEAEAAREASELESVKVKTVAAAESAWRSSNAALSRYETLDTMALPAARESADLARFAYREGRIDLFRLLDAERTLSETEKGRWEAYAAWGSAHAELLFVAGADGQ